MSGAIQAFGQGMRDAIPIMVGYVPAAFAMGAAAASLGFGALEAGAWSFIMFSGANQALFLSSIKAGTPLLVIALLACLASLRHILYSIALRKYVQAVLWQRLWFAYGLTDEVFAIASTLDDHSKSKAHGFWYIGLAMTALWSWVLGTYAGVAAGDVLAQSSDDLRQALDFAMPALFIALVWSSFKRRLIGNLALAGILAAASILLGYPTLAIPAGACAAFVNFGGRQ